MRSILLTLTLIGYVVIPSFGFASSPLAKPFEEELRTFEALLKIELDPNKQALILKEIDSLKARIEVIAQEELQKAREEQRQEQENFAKMLPFWVSGGVGVFTHLVSILIAKNVHQPLAPFQNSGRSLLVCVPFAAGATIWFGDYSRFPLFMGACAGGAILPALAYGH